MKKTILYIILLSFVATGFAASSKRNTNAAKSTSAKTKRPLPKAQAQKPARNVHTKTQTSPYSQRLSEALRLAREGQYQSASAQLFSLSRRSELKAEKMQIKYILGLMFYELKLFQVSAFQFVDVVRTGDSRYTKQSLEKLSFAADSLGDDTLLNYAISKVRVDDFPDSQKDMLYFRLGEVKQKTGQIDQAGEFFLKVRPQSRYYSQARFLAGLANLEESEVEEAIKIYKDLYNHKRGATITDTTKVATTMALARSYYQKQDWENAVKYYREVPRDTPFWHEALFESSWALLRAGKFRSALNNFQTLHSDYYADTYQAESLLLRAIVYLYICQYEEMDKVLGLFEKIYGPAKRDITHFLRQSDPLAYFAEVEKVEKARRDKNIKDPSQTQTRVPYGIVRDILAEGDVSRAMSYLYKLYEEKNRVESMGAWSSSPVGRYAIKIINNRIKNNKVIIGDMVKNHMLRVKAELVDLYEQAGFVRYEMINGQKELLKKKIADKTFEKTQIDEEMDRKFYVQNGYEYWPFKGEFWLDELGNYQYLGKQSCE